ncbi:hypothetical protein LINPERHAP2_LOCUS1264 [Linum perenne]
MIECSELIRDVRLWKLHGIQGLQGGQQSTPTEQWSRVPTKLLQVG